LRCSVNAVSGTNEVDERTAASVGAGASASFVMPPGDPLGDTLFSQTSQGLTWTTNDGATASVESSQQTNWDAPGPEPHDVSLEMVTHDLTAASNSPPSASYSVHTSRDESSRNQQPTAGYSGTPVAVNAEMIPSGSNWANQMFVSVLNTLTIVYLTIHSAHKFCILNHCIPQRMHHRIRPSMLATHLGWRIFSSLCVMEIEITFIILMYDQTSIPDRSDTQKELRMYITFVISTLFRCTIRFAQDYKLSHTVDLMYFPCL
jgi:hypothetical protein